ncbi:MAG: glycosyltransferase [Candidatus Falkowbacteria bacterium]|nr:glycosyltransferase [Candidatus Falkowbacteria bacterium]
MKICFVNNIYGESARGGAEKVIERLVNNLLTKGHELTIISGALKTSVANSTTANLKYVYLPSKYSLLVNKSTLYKLFFHFFSFFNIISTQRLGRIIKQEKFDLVWTHNLVGLNLLSFKFLGKAKKIHTFHDIQLLHPSGLMLYGKEARLDNFSSQLYQLFSRLVFPASALGVFPSNWLKSIYSKYYLLPKNSLVLKNPMDHKSVIKTEQKNETFNFLYLGQLEKHKGIELLIESFLLLDNSNAKLLIAGSGLMETELKTKYQTNSNIIFLGKVASAEIAFKNANCLVVPSLCYENLPTVALEAANTELPVIGSNLGGIPEAIGDDSLLFEPNKESLMEKLNWCLTNKEGLKKVAANARQQINIPNTDSYLETIGKIVGISF